MAKTLLSENAQTILSYLQGSTAQETAVTIAEATGLNTKSVNGVATGLAKRGLVERVEVEGVEKKVIALTAEGRDFDPYAVAE
jgi:DNA-binding MarR family transcriptional regulator